MNITIVHMWLCRILIANLERAALNPGNW